MEENRISRRKALSLIGGSALAAALPAGVARAQGAPLRFGIQTTIWGAVAILAEAEKTFAKAGANVVVNKFDSGANARDAMIGGHIDVVNIGASPFVIGVAKSNLVAIGMSSYAGGTLALVGSKRKGIKSIADLRGKKIASQLGSQTDYVFQNKIMPAFGMKKGDYQVINTKFADHASAMASGSVDAFAGVEPYPSVAELGGFGVVLTNYMKYDIVPVLLGTNRKVLTTRTDDLVKFMKGWQLAIDIFKKDRKYAAKVVGDFFRGRGYKMDDGIFARAMSTMDVTTTYRPEVKGYLTTMAETLVKRKRLDGVPNIGAALDERIIKAAM